MGRPATRPAPKSGAALRYERQRREATAALAAQAAQVRELRAGRVAPPPSAGEVEGDVSRFPTSWEVPKSDTAGRAPGGIEQIRPDRQLAKPLSAQKKSAAVDEPGPGRPDLVQARRPGDWPIADLREGQCRFACTGFRAQPADHRFCGEPVAWKGGKPTSWCREHLPVVSGAPGRWPGGASVADVEALEAAKGA